MMGQLLKVLLGARVGGGSFVMSHCMNVYMYACVCHACMQL